MKYVFRFGAVLIFIVGVALILPLPVLFVNGALALVLGHGFLPSADVGDWVARAILSLPTAGAGVGFLGLGGLVWGDE